MTTEHRPRAEIGVGADIDVHELMAEVKAEVERKRRAGLYPPDVLEELDVLMGDGSDDSLNTAMLLLRQSAGFTPFVSTRSSKGVAAPLAASFKRVVRSSTGWYMSAMLQQVELFAAHSIRVIGLLSERIRRLEERFPDTLEELRREFGDQLVEAQESADAMVRAQERLAADFEAVQNDAELARWRERVALLERSVRGLRGRLMDEVTGDAKTPLERGFDADLAVDYLDFENHFRGSEDAISGQQRAYVDHFIGCPGPVVDLGCGRGEFLELLSGDHIEVYGVDRHPDMIDLCREKGLDAREADALEYLASVSPASLGGIFSAQMIEHLDVREVPRFFELAADVLAPGGKLVVETINPESLFVFAAAFYVDLGHLRPLHPLTLQFLAEKAGFTDVHIEYFAPPPAELRPAAVPPTGRTPLDDVIGAVNENFDRIDKVVFGPQDYALIATR